jgi:hypothetical protein
MAEILRARPGSDNQRIIGQLSIAQEDLALGKVEIDYFCHQHRHLWIIREHGAERVGDIAGGQTACRDLIEQRLEEVKVPPIHQRNPHRRAPQCLGGMQATEAAPDDHDVMKVVIAHNATSSSPLAVYGAGRPALRCRHSAGRVL